jgi:hypothetical protein
MERVNVGVAVATPLVAGFLFMHWFPGGGAPSVDFVRGVGIWMALQGLGMGSALSLRLIGPLARDADIGPLRRRVLGAFAFWLSAVVGAGLVIALVDASGPAR